MNELFDLPGELNLVLYVGRASTPKLTWPVGTLVGRTFTATVGFPTPATYACVVTGNDLTFTVPAAALTVEARSLSLVITETTGGGSVPIIAGWVNVTHGVGASAVSGAVQLVTQSGVVTVGITGQPGPAGGPGIPTYATAAARNAATAPTAGLLVYLSTPQVYTYGDGTTWRGLASKSYDSSGPGQATIAAAALDCITLTVPDQGVAGFIHVSVFALVNKTVTGDTFEGKVFDGATVLATQSVVPSTISAGYLSMTTRTTAVAGAANAIKLTCARTAGTGNAAIYGDPTVTRLEAIFVPT